MSAFTNRELQELFANDWAWEMADNPEFASQSGEHDVVPVPGKELQDLSPGAYTVRKEHSQQMLEAIQNIQRTCTLSKSEAVYAALFERSHREIIQAIDSAPMYLLPINSMMAGGVLFSFSESIEWMRFESVADYQVYLGRLKAYPRQINQFIESMRAGIASGYTASTAMVRSVQQQMDDILGGDLADFFAPLKEASAPGILAQQDGLQAALEAAIAGIKPALIIFRDFYLSEYVPSLRTDPACSALPNGLEAYNILLKCHTTTDLTADEVHEIGLKEVANIEARYVNDVLLPLGFEPDKFAEFVEFVRHDPQFYVPTAEALLDVYRTTCKKIEGLMPQYFNEIPRSPLQITSKPGGPAAYYLAGTADGKRPGRFYVNVSHIEKRPVYENVSLSLHEAIPGHHHQASIALENEAIPNFLRFIEDRRYEVFPARRNFYCGYVEGWALYTELLGEEMGVYTTPYELFGKLSMEMMRAVRLVVDTGLHTKNWGIEKCIDYMMEKTGMHRHEVEVEIYRYAGWPGQACSYKIGQIEIVRLRAKAQEELGSLFNIKDFHSLCLNSGPLPLTLLGEMVDDWIREVKQRS